MLNELERAEAQRLFNLFRKSIIFFVEKMWGLKPQPLKEEYKKEMQDILNLKGETWMESIKQVKSEWFDSFEKGKHITWQQWVVLLCVEKAIRGDAPCKISIASGHGIGKSMIISLIILWYLFVNYNAQVPCTAPTADQMYDVLWKELNLWISKMPEGVKGQYVWGKDHIRMKESPETWFARAKTSSKENSEALAGVHADHVLTIADEASGIEEQIFNTAEGAWTSGDILVILISNPTRSEGYFYDTHHKLKKNWQCLQFSSMESPIVDVNYESSIAERHGRESVEYGVRVLGKFPDIGIMDSSGYVPLYPNIPTQPDFSNIVGFSKNAVLGVDPAGEGRNKTSWVIRDNNKAKKVAEESKSNAKTIAEKTMTLMEQYGIEASHVIVDAFGAGKDVGKEIAIASKGELNVTTVNVGDKSEEDDLYINKRAEYYYKSRQWFQQGGEIVEDKAFQEDLAKIRFKRNIAGKIQIMPKEVMKKKYGYDSPDDADAFSLTFAIDIPTNMISKIALRQEEVNNEDFDPFSVFG